jgi:hypothetical protein
VNFAALTRTGRTCCGYRWLVVLESKAAEMIRFRHYKEAGGKKTVLGKGNSHDNWTLRDDLWGDFRGPVGCESRSWLTGDNFRERRSWIQVWSAA